MSTFPAPRQSNELQVRSGFSLARRQPSGIGEVVSAFESETAAVFARTAPHSEHLILYVLAAMFLFGIVMLSVTKLDIVVSGTGKIVPAQGSIYIQSLNQAPIRDIRVKVGDFVHKGQVLATLDPTFASATLVQTQEKLASDRAQVTRLQAEVADRPYVPMGDGSYENLQFSIWKQRQSEYQSSVANYDAQIANGIATTEQLRKDIDQYTQRSKLAGQIEQMDSTLEQKGWGSRLKTLTSADTRIELQRLLSDSQNQLIATRETVASLRAQKAAYIQKWHSDAGSELVTVRNDLDTTAQNLRTATELRQLVDITTPVDAIVVKIGKESPGSVAGPPADPTSQEPLFTLVPVGGSLEAQVDIATQDAGFVKVGEPVSIKLDAYRYLQYGMAKGIVKAVSASSFKLDTETQQPVDPYVDMRIKITSVRLRHLPENFHLTPGMTVTADVLVGRRTIMSYLVEGVLRTTSEAMREP